MVKKIKIGLLVIISFCSFFHNVLAYEFINKDNETRVNDIITQIYDAKQQYEDLAGDYEEEPEPEIVIQQTNNVSYWWPIGSQETIEVNGKVYAKGEPYPTRVGSKFGYRIHPITGEYKLHSGVDISGAAGNGEVNIIAAKDGIVTYPGKDAPTNCPSSSSMSSCGGGYGNYVVIQHSDGNYTLYAHLHADTITVSAGDSVEQGQVIGKMGTSGNSTGTHLHFEVRKGGMDKSALTEPLEYVSLENPRTVSNGNEFLDWLNSWEGHSPIEGDYYIIEDIGDGVRTVGGGVTLEHNVGRFSQYGINVDDYKVGDKISIKIIDQIQLEEIADKRNTIEKILSENSVVLKENQIQALLSQMYNCGNINGFVSAYAQFGNTQAFYDNWFLRAIMKGTKFERGLTRRRESEWALFHTGEYVYNR